MNYFKIEYGGRNSAGCNAREGRQKIVKCETSSYKDVIAVLLEVIQNDPRQFQWPWTVETIENITPATEQEYRDQGAVDAKEWERTNNKKMWSKYLQELTEK